MFAPSGSADPGQTTYVYNALFSLMKRAISLVLPQYYAQCNKALPVSAANKLITLYSVGIRGLCAVCLHHFQPRCFYNFVNSGIKYSPNKQLPPRFASLMYPIMALSGSPFFFPPVFPLPPSQTPPFAHPITHTHRLLVDPAS